MIEGTKNWNEQFIKSIIREEDARYILNTRVGSITCQDTPVWNFTRTGEYTVRSGYHLCNQNVNELISLVKKDKRELLNFFIGWRVWKKRNNLIFQQKRDHIVKVIHDAIRDLGQWEEANSSLKQQCAREERPKENPLQAQHTMPTSAQYYCQVDASWRNDEEVAGVGWSLHSIQGNQLLQGSSSIHATNTPREAETEALRMAVRQVRALAFSKVHFISDCKSLMDELAQHLTGATIVKVRNTESFSMIQDIVEASKANGYTFSYMSRNRLSLVDKLAKNARCNKQNYVITWF
ncbi:hypothetical protein IGI04_026715 [Brassica rapa subsp. trilocularis]|uniref:RNase H type-1 domain-containing protein n=1 Tax=Brassica rapa subsp. trilocularis TaxID=1813537 RepID=A0ABQ7KX55_BRACM|nr:hypothetical protein IGI04_026715 [Brassica rapa subsp. trilocularis]